jgi:hypothetical protein
MAASSGAREGRQGRGKGSELEREREEGAGELIPSQAVGGGGDHLARIDGQSSARQLLVDRRRKTTRRWAGPQLGRYLLCCAADKREGELAGPKNSPTRKREGKPLSFFQFSCFKQFWLFATL